MALGFDVQHLEDCSGAKLERCIYSGKKKRAALNELAYRLISSFGPASEHGTQADEMIKRAPEIMTLAARMKHPGFAVEKEVRLLWMEREAAPYRQFSVVACNGLVPDIGVRRVVVARIDDFDQKSAQVRRKFEAAGLSVPDIVQSAIPIRKKPASPSG